jgi:hypothetical protein
VLTRCWGAKSANGSHVVRTGRLPRWKV